RRWRTSDWTPLPSFSESSFDEAGRRRWTLGPMALSPDGRLIAILYGFTAERYPVHPTESTIYLWDAGTGERRGEPRTPAGGAHPTALAFSPDGRLLVAIEGAYLRVWDVGTRAQVTSSKAGRRKHTALAFAPDGRRLVTASGDTSVRLWDTSSWGEVRRY